MEKKDIDAIADAVREPLSAEVKNAVAGAVKPVEEGMKAIDERLKKVEALPVGGQAPAIKKFESSYKGYDLESQGGRIIERASKSHGFNAFRSEEKMHEYKKWMIDFIKGRVFGNLDSLSLLQKASMNETTGSQGGYLVPTIYEQDMIRLAREDSFALKLCKVIQMGKPTMLFPKEGTLVSVNWIAEAGSITKSDPTYAQVTLTAKKLAGLTNPVSNELLADSDFDIVSELTEQFAYAMGQEFDNQVLNGTGSPVSGVMTAKAGYSVVLGAGKVNFSSVTAQDLRSLIRKLSSKDAINGTFVYSKDIQYYIDTLVDTAGQFIYRQPYGEKPATLWSRPVVEASRAPAEADSGTGKGFVAFGDFEKFYIGIRKGVMTLDVDPYGAFANDQTSFRMVTRAGMEVARDTAFARLVTA